MFTLKVCSHLMFAFAFASTSPLKFKHCANGNANTNAQNGSEPILDVSVCISVDAMLNVDANANIKC